MDGKPRDLKLGESFGKDGMAFHSIRYDFQPASVDVTKMAAVEIQEKNSVTVTVPHLEGSGTLNTVYKGNKRPVQKECVLIFDHNTGQLSLEKLSNTIQLKKTRIEGSSRASQSNRPLTPSEQMGKIKEQKSSPVKKGKSSQSQSSSSQQQSQPPVSAAKKDRPSPSPVAVPEPAASSPVEMMSDSSSDSDSASDDSDDEGKSSPVQTAVPRPTGGYASLRDDLKLSESGSDSD